MAVNSIKNNKMHDFLAGGGEMGERIRAFDWSKTKVGPVESWPQSLRTAISICLNATMPLSIVWGKDLVQFYNDAYIPIATGRHPGILGGLVPDNWPDTWSGIKDYFEGVFQGEPVYVEDSLLVTTRQGMDQETYYTMSFSPIRDESGQVGGVFHAILNTTEEVLHERRLRTSRSLASIIAEVKTTNGLFSKAVEVLSDNSYDFSFVSLYEVKDGDQLNLHSINGIPKGLKISPDTFNIENINTQESKEIWKPVLDGKVHVVEDLEHFSVVMSEVWSVPVKKAVLLPITLPGKLTPEAVLVVGVSPKLVLDDSYLNFLEQVTRQITASIASIQAYEEERKRAEALAEIDKAKTTFFSNVSHEFRTPLTLMLSPIEELLAKQGSEILPENQKLLNLVHRNALRLQKLVNTLLDFSRIEAGRVKASFKPTDLSRLTSDIASSFRSAIEKAGLRFIVETNPLPEPVCVDRDMWEKIILNLLSNAFKHTFEGEIKVYVSWTGNGARLTVEDTGIGIQQDQLPHLFERFHQVPDARSRTHEGSGIGLALVHELVKIHKGNIEVESEPGVGTKFVVTVPAGKTHLPANQVEVEVSSDVVAAEAFVEEAIRWSMEGEIEEPNFLSGLEKSSVQQEAWESTTPGSSDKAYIVLADDNKDMRDYIRHLLQDYCDINVVPDGQAALDAIREKAPDLILSDVMMPVVDGFEFLKQVRNDSDLQSIPFILLSARAGEEAKVEGFEAGADDYLIKPFAAKELLARVKTHLALSRIRKQAAHAVKVERQKLYDLMMNAPASVAIVSGQDLVFEFANPNYRKLVGAKRSIDGKPLLEVLPDLPLDLFNVIKKVSFEGERFSTRELPLFLDWDENGKPFYKYFNLTYEPLLDENSKPNGFIAFAFEITDQVEAKHLIKESELKYRSLFRAMDQGFCLLEMIFDDSNTPVDYKFLEINPVFEEQTGLKDAVGKTAKELVPDLESHWFEMYGNVALTGQHTRFIEESDAMGRWFEVYAFRIGGKGSKRIALLFTDITERKEYEENLKQKNEELLRINNDLDNFIYTASHDLKAPVSNLEGLFITLLSEMEVSEDLEGVKVMIDSSFERFKSTLRDLTDITKIQKGEAGELEEIKFEDIVEDVKVNIKDQIEHYDAEIKTDFSVPSIKFSGKNLRSIIYNFVSNGIKYSSPDRKPVVTVSTEKEKDFIVLKISDNGLGIPKENQDKIFTMFKRLHDHVEGTGIGLYIVKRIIENAGGKIEIESEVGKGSTFKVYFKD